MEFTISHRSVAFFRRHNLHLLRCDHETLGSVSSVQKWCNKTRSGPLPRPRVARVSGFKFAPLGPPMLVEPYRYWASERAVQVAFEPADKDTCPRATS